MLRRRKPVTPSSVLSGLNGLTGLPALPPVAEASSVVTGTVCCQQKEHSYARVTAQRSGSVTPTPVRTGQTGRSGAHAPNPAMEGQGLN